MSDLPWQVRRCRTKPLEWHTYPVHTYKENRHASMFHATEALAQRHATELNEKHLRQLARQAENADDAHTRDDPAAAEAG